MGTRINISKISIAVIIFSIAMGMFEASVVIYLRALYYPEGFAFPLKLTSGTVAITELLRELASLFMIGSVAYIAGKKFTQRFGLFLIIFAIWDVFYYIFLKAIIGWPESLLTWDILFLIPVHWTGPVVSPIVISLIMIAWGVTILYFSQIAQKTSAINIREWLLLGAGAFVVFVAFILDYTLYLIENFNQYQNFELANKFNKLSMNYSPDQFYWVIYSFGLLLLMSSLGFYIYRNLKEKQP